MAKRKNKKRKKFTLLILVVLVVTLLISFISLYNSFTILNIRSLNASLSVSNKIGIELNGTALKFGAVLPRGESKKTLILKNYYNFPVKIYLVPKGEIKKFVEKQVIFLDVGEEKKVEIIAKVPANANYGNYDGKVLIIIKRA